MAKSTPRPPADGERVATILAEAALKGDAATAKKHNVSTRTLRRWRISADTVRPEVAAQVSANVRDARDLAVAGLAKELERSLDEIVAYVRWAAGDVKRKKAKPNAIMVQSMVSAFKTFSEHLGGKGDGEKAAPTTINIFEAAPPAPPPIPPPAPPTDADDE